MPHINIIIIGTCRRRKERKTVWKLYSSISKMVQPTTIKVTNNNYINVGIHRCEHLHICSFFYIILCPIEILCHSWNPLGLRILFARPTQRMYWILYNHVGWKILYSNDVWSWRIRPPHNIEQLRAIRHYIGPIRCRTINSVGGWIWGAMHSNRSVLWICIWIFILYTNSLESVIHWIVFVFW